MTDKKEHKVEHKKTEHKKVEHHHSNKKEWNVWMIISIIFGIILVVGFFTGIINVGATGGVSSSEASDKVISFLNTELLPLGVTATSQDVNLTSGMYLVTFSVEDDEYNAFVSTDGRYFFPQMPIDMEALPEQNNQQNQQQTVFDAPDTEEPKVELFVMSFCPYGQQAENAMIPVVEVMKDVVTVEPHFIVSVDDEGNVGALHGENEANENMRQAVIWKYYEDDFWNYVYNVNSNCQLNNIETCWETQAESVGIDVDDIKTKTDEEGISLMESDSELAGGYNARSSPTLIINGEKFSGSRTPATFRDGICSGFVEQPDECLIELSSDVAAAAGNC